MSDHRVPGNRWDLRDGQWPEHAPLVSVVVAHYAQPRALARTLAALARQDYPTELLEVIVADDGSPDEPVVPEGVRLVRHDDDGFRLAAVRNLGARAARGDVLCFLDADTTPEPSFVRVLTRLPALLAEAVTVGRRRHADLRDVPVDAPIQDAAPPRALADPGWLVDAYARTADLLHADDRSYRYMIGAVISCRRAFFDEVGGFDESFTEYGGEDWEWAHRAWQSGAVFAHTPGAVAWHDGPDWAGRALDERARRANRQTVTLASAIPVDGSRGRGLLTATPDLVVHLRGAHTDAATFVCVDSALASFPRAQVVLDAVPEMRALRDDPRVRAVDAGGVPDARVTLVLTHPVVFGEGAARALHDRFSRLGSGREGAVDVFAAEGAAVGAAVSRRARRRAARWGDGDGFRTGALNVPDLWMLRPEPHVESYVGGWGGVDRLT